MKIVSLKRTDAEKQKDQTLMTAPGGSEAEDYGWGLRLNLGNEEVEKLGLDPASCDVGDILDIAGKAKVISISSSADAGRPKSVRVELVVTDLGLDCKADEAEVAERMYGASTKS